MRPEQFESKAKRLNFLVETLKNVNELFERTPELQEGENRQTISQFRQHLVSRILRDISYLNDNLRQLEEEAE